MFGSGTGESGGLWSGRPGVAWLAGAFAADTATSECGASDMWGLDRLGDLLVFSLTGSASGPQTPDNGPGPGAGLGRGRVGRLEGSSTRGRRGCAPRSRLR